MRNGEELARELRKGLHDVGQPLSALHCRLYLAGIEEGSTETLRIALAESMGECERTIARVRELQDLVEGYAEAGR